MSKWRTIPGHPAYSASTTGLIRRDLAGKGAVAGRILTPTDNGRGYMTVMLTEDGAQIRRSVHGLVAAAWVGPCPAEHEVNHIDLDRGNNEASNLEYVTSSGNKLHALAAGGGAPGLRNGMGRLTPDEVATIRQLSGTMSQRAIAARVGCSQTHVSMVARGKSRALA